MSFEESRTTTICHKVDGRAKGKVSGTVLNNPFLQIKRVRLAPSAPMEPLAGVVVGENGSCMSVESFSRISIPHNDK